MLCLTNCSLLVLCNRWNSVWFPCEYWVRRIKFGVSWQIANGTSKCEELKTLFEKHFIIIMINNQISFTLFYQFHVEIFLEYRNYDVIYIF
jgi:hypothetical protein